MILELKVRLIAQVPADALGGGATPEALAQLAEAKAKERLQALFAGWPTDVKATATVDGRDWARPTH